MLSLNSFVQPPYSGTVYIDPDIITATDFTTYQSLTYTGQAQRTMYDYRTSSFNQVNALLFEVNYSDGYMVEFQINPEFGTAQLAQQQVEIYAPAIGRIPKALRQGLQTVWIHKGNHSFGGGNNNFLIHINPAD